MSLADLARALWWQAAGALSACGWPPGGSRPTPPRTCSYLGSGPVLSRPVYHGWWNFVKSEPGSSFLIKFVGGLRFTTRSHGKEKFSLSPPRFDLKIYLQFGRKVLLLALFSQNQINPPVLPASSGLRNTISLLTGMGRLFQAYKWIPGLFLICELYLRQKVWVSLSWGWSGCRRGGAWWDSSAGPPGSAGQRSHNYCNETNF